MAKVSEQNLAINRERLRFFNMMYPSKDGKCIVSWCNRDRRVKNLCNRHYQEWLRYGTIRIFESIADDISGEIWKDIPSAKGYQASNFGRVRGVPRLVKRGDSDMVIRGTVLSPAVDAKGYKRVNISGRSRLVHRLVAEAFIPNPGHLPQINHIDANPSNNKADNLEWADQSRQEIHKIYTMGTQGSIYNLRPVRCVESGEEFPSLHEACRKTGVPLWVLFSRLRSGKKDPFGRSWEYVV